MAVRIIALSLAMTARSSAAVLQARTCRIRSRSLSDMIYYICCVCFEGRGIARGEGFCGLGCLLAVGLIQMTGVVAKVHVFMSMSLCPTLLAAEDTILYLPHYLKTTEEDSCSGSCPCWFKRDRSSSPVTIQSIEWQCCQ
mmetsp:Transcript_36791/g.77201  ORF Transcript_36791/g.77201 Transcript_36791/m.77201 type:complete len:140 (+) Transcript_36791:1204-1623(+)